MPKSQFDPPNSVSVPCYLMIGVAAVIAARGILLHFFPKPSLGTEAFPTSLLVIDFTQAILLSACAILMLGGRNWARVCYFILCAGNLLVAFTLQGKNRLMLNGAVAGIEMLGLGVWLFTFRARRYFAGLDPHRGKSPPNSDHASRIENSRRGRFDY